jgi:hypothetical protein
MPRPNDMAPSGGKLMMLMMTAVVLVLATITVVSIAGDQPISTTHAGDEAEISKTIESIEAEEDRAVLEGDTSKVNELWPDGFTVNAPNNQMIRKPAILALMKTHTGLQYSKFERHREALIVPGDGVVTMGYEIVVPKGNAPNSGKTVKRRYTNIFYRDGGRWPLIARQATIISVE